MKISCVSRVLYTFPRLYTAWHQRPSSYLLNVQLEVLYSYAFLKLPQEDDLVDFFVSGHASCHSTNRQCHGSGRSNTCLIILLQFCNDGLLESFNLQAPFSLP